MVEVRWFEVIIAVSSLFFVVVVVVVVVDKSKHRSVNWQLLVCMCKYVI